MEVKTAVVRWISKRTYMNWGRWKQFCRKLVLQKLRYIHLLRKILQNQMKQKCSYTNAAFSMGNCNL